MIFFKFILWFLLSEAIIFGIRFLLRNKELKLWVEIVITIAEFGLSILMAFLPMAGPMALRPLHPFMLGMYVALMMDSIAKAICLIVTKLKSSEKSWKQLTAISCILGVLFLMAGMVNMQIVTPKNHTFTSSKLANEYKVAFVSDLHIGSAQTVETTKKTISKIKSENPDFTFIGGDLVDEYTKEADMKDALSAFKDFTTPVYFIYGNHDPFSEAGIDGLEATLLENNIIIVKDEFVVLGADLTLLGRVDASDSNRKKAEDLYNPYDGTYLLVVDHQPVPFKDNCKIGIDLQLSGHTHAGQLFPLNEMYEVIADSYGEFHNSNATMYISSGASGWRDPIRTSRGCHYEIVNLKPVN